MLRRKWLRLLSLSGHFDNKGGGIVAAGVFDGFAHQHLGEFVRGGGGVKEFFNSSVPESVDKTVAADQETIAVLTAHGADLRFDELVA